MFTLFDVGCLRLRALLNALSCTGAYVIGLNVFSFLSVSKKDSPIGNSSLANGDFFGLFDFFGDVRFGGELVL